MTIQRIAESNGYKLLAFNQQVSQKGNKPFYTSVTFADFKDGILRTFAANSSMVVCTGTWKECLQYVRKLSTPIYNR